MRENIDLQKVNIIKRQLYSSPSGILAGGFPLGKINGSNSLVIAGALVRPFFHSDAFKLC